jgi:hypothetical protein
MSDTRRVFDRAEGWPDTLSGWVIPPGGVEPIRVFDTAEAAMAFLARWNAAAERRPRYLKATATH